MAGSFSVTPEQLQEVSMQLRSGEEQITQILAQLASQVSPLSGSWSGTAQAQFEELWAQWQRQAAGLHEALSGIAALTLRAAEEYRAAEQNVTSMFQP
jgi:WXG100 family type VII secretion target